MYTLRTYRTNMVPYGCALNANTGQSTTVSVKKHPNYAHQLTGLDGSMCGQESSPDYLCANGPMKWPLYG